MTEEKMVTMRAYGALDDAHAGHVEEGEEFETTERDAKFYRKAKWAGDAGVDPRVIQVEVAAEAYAEKREARRQMKAARQYTRNLSLADVQRGNSAGVDIMPSMVVMPEGEAPRTSAQTPGAVKVDGDDRLGIPHADDLGDRDAPDQSDDQSKKGKNKE